MFIMLALLWKKDKIFIKEIDSITLYKENKNEYWKCNATDVRQS